MVGGAVGGLGGPTLKLPRRSGSSSLCYRARTTEGSFNYGTERRMDYAQGPGQPRSSGADAARANDAIIAGCVTPPRIQQVRSARAPLFLPTPPLLLTSTPNAPLAFPSTPAETSPGRMLKGWRLLSFFLFFFPFPRSLLSVLRLSTVLAPPRARLRHAARH